MQRQILERTGPAPPRAGPRRVEAQLPAAGRAWKNAPKAFPQPPRATPIPIPSRPRRPRPARFESASLRERSPAARNRRRIARIPSAPSPSPPWLAPSPSPSPPPSGAGLRKKSICKRGSAAAASSAARAGGGGGPGAAGGGARGPAGTAAVALTIYLAVTPTLKASNTNAARDSLLLGRLPIEDFQEGLYERLRLVESCA